jgi:multidrug efflux pump subunit AcrB
MSEKSLPDGVGYSYSNDQSARTRLRLQVLGGNALLGFALVAIVLMLALNLHSAFWTAMSVPFSLFGCFILVPQFGITLNVVSLAGFVLVLGLLVDDAIVVAEKITHYREQGLSPLAAAQQGTAEMWKPVMVASITTILAFSPMFQLGGMPGKFAWAIPAVVILALSVSLFDSFFVLPHHLASGRPGRIKGKPRWILALESGYAWLLEHLLHWRYLVILVMLGVFAGGIYIVKNHMRVQMFPQEGVETIYVKLEMPRGASIDATEKRIIEIESVIAALPDSELESHASRIGTLSTEAAKDKGDHSHWGVIRIYLTGEARRTRSADDIIGALRRAIPPGDDEKLLFDKQRVGPPIGKPIEIRISSNDDALRAQTAADVHVFLSGLPGVFDLETDNKPGKDQLIVDIDYQRLAEVNLTVNDIADALRVTFDGTLVSSTSSVEETLEYRVIMAPEFRSQPDIIYQIPVRNAQNKVLTLKDVLTLNEGSGPLEFNHYNGMRSETISGDLDVDITTVRKITTAVKARFADTWATHPGMKVEFGGEAREAKKVFGSFVVAGLIALVSIFLVVAVLFNSLGQPLIVMSVIPFAVVGVIYAFFAHGQPLSFFSTMGTLGLIGVVVNDTIIMVTEINASLRKNPDSYLVRTIVTGARNRLRPVLLTTITTAVGLLPTAYGIGGRDALIMPLTLAMAWGLLFATIITLVLTPSLVTAGTDLGRLFGSRTGHKRGRAPAGS